MAEGDTVDYEGIEHIVKVIVTMQTEDGHHLVLMTRAAKTSAGAVGTQIELGPATFLAGVVGRERGGISPQLKETMDLKERELTGLHELQKQVGIAGEAYLCDGSATFTAIDIKSFGGKVPLDKGSNQEQVTYYNFDLGVRSNAEIKTLTEEGISLQDKVAQVLLVEVERGISVFPSVSGANFYFIASDTGYKVTSSGNSALLPCDSDPVEITRDNDDGRVLEMLMHSKGVALRPSDPSVDKIPFHVIDGSRDDPTLVQRYGRGLIHQIAGILKMAANNEVKITTAESATGGAIFSLLTSLSGSAAVMGNGGFIVYNDDAKTRLLGVSEELLESDTAVSRSVAKAMAIGALEHSNTDISVAITGYLGVHGDSDRDIPGGTVFVATAINTEAATGPLVEVEKLNITSTGRIADRDAAIKGAFNMLQRAVEKCVGQDRAARGR